MEYNDYVIKAILTNEKFEITEVKGLQSLNSRCYVRNEYAQIENLIKDKNFNALKALPANEGESSEYLDIVEFKNQADKFYIATIYDSNELWQDPELIEIYSL